MNTYSPISPKHLIKKDNRPLLFLPEIIVKEPYDLSHYIVLDGNILKGMLPREEIETESSTFTVSSLLYIKVYEDDNLLDVFRIMLMQQLDLIPVLNRKEEYTGYYLMEEILDLWSESPIIHEEGTSLILEKTNKDIHFSEIAQIIESENALIQGMFILNKDDNNTRVLIRIQTENMNETVQSLRRYDYKVYSHNIEDFLQEQLIERSEYLQKYLDI